MKCPNCGFENPDDALFCANCGTKLEKESAAPLSGAAAQAPDASGKKSFLDSIINQSLQAATGGKKDTTVSGPAPAPVEQPAAQPQPAPAFTAPVAEPEPQPAPEPVAEEPAPVTEPAPEPAPTPEEPAPVAEPVPEPAPTPVEPEVTPAPAPVETVATEEPAAPAGPEPAPEPAPMAPEATLAEEKAAEDAQKAAQEDAVLESLDHKMICPACGAQIPEDSAFCPNCGAPIGPKPDAAPAQRTCPKCGTPVPEDSVFCPNCGTRIEQQQNPITQQPVGYGDSIPPYLRQANQPTPQPVPAPGPQNPTSSQQPPYASQQPVPGQQPGSLQSAPGQQPPYAPQQPAPQPVPAPKKKKKSKLPLIIGIIIAVLVALIGAAAVYLFVLKPTIDLNPYLDVKFDGYSVIGTATAEFDEGKFEEDWGKKIGIRNKVLSVFNREDASEDPAADFLSDCVDYSLNKADGLANGDTVTVSFTCDDTKADKSYGCKLKYADADFTVDGLEEAEVFDPFQGMDLEVDGMSGEAYGYLTGTPADPAAYDFSFDLDKSESLSNGDTVTATISAGGEDPVTYCIEQYGKLPQPTSKTFDVTGLDAYITKLDEIPAADLDAMKSNAEDEYGKDETWPDDEVLQDYEYLGTILMTKDPSTVSEDDGYYQHNELYIVIREDIYNNYDSYHQVNSVYRYIGYSDLVLHADSTTNYEDLYTEWPDDTCTFEIDNSYVYWEYYGYATLDELYDAIRTEFGDTYVMEDDIDSALANAPADTSVIPEEEEEPTEEGIIFPDSSEELIPEEDIEALSDEDLRLAINEIYAREGYTFTKDDMIAYYSQFDWYEPIISADDFTMDDFNDIERQNVEALQKERDSRN